MRAFFFGGAAVHSSTLCAHGADRGSEGCNFGGGGTGTRPPRPALRFKAGGGAARVVMSAAAPVGGTTLNGSPVGTRGPQRCSSRVGGVAARQASRRLRQ